MKIVKSDEQGRLEPVARGVAIGFFDGMHRGHQQVVRTLMHMSAAKGLRSCIYTFDIHPSSLINGRVPPHGFLCGEHERLQCLAAAGTDEIYLQRFDQQLAELDANEFLDRVLVDKLGARLIVVGYDFRFGKNRSGHADALREWAAQRDVEVVVVEAFTLGQEAASSTQIRRLVAEGRVDEAAVFLGRDYSVESKVERGRRLGSRLGFPTANLTVAKDKVMPAPGVYVTRTVVDQIAYESITNVGTRPTIDQTDERVVVESFLFDTEADLYDKQVVVQFLRRLREEIRFDGLLPLSAQIHEDIEAARAWHVESERLWLAATLNTIPFYVLRSNRFRTSILTVTFRMPIDPRRATAWNLLSRILTAHCRRFPTRRELSLALDRLYGTRIHSSVVKEGDVICLHFSIDAISAWLDGTHVFAQAADLLLDVIDDPHVDQEGFFDDTVVELERAAYIDELRGRQNDRDRYAYHQGVAFFLDGTPHGVDADGDLGCAATTTRFELQHAYREMLHTAAVTVVAGGAIDAAQRGRISERLSMWPSGSRLTPSIPGKTPGPFTAPSPAEIRTRQEPRPAQQARMLAVFSGLPPYFSNEGLAVTVLNSMFGAGTHSLLFTYVREELQLAYSVYSVALRYVNGLAVYAGVAPGDVERALDAMVQQWQALAAGTHAPAVFSHAITMLRTELATTADHLSTLLRFYMAGLANGRLFHIREALAMLDDVTPAQIMRLASALQLASVYTVGQDEPKEELP